MEAALARALAELDWDIDVEALLQTWFATDLEIDHDVVRAVDGWATSGVRLVIVTNQEVRRARFLERVLTGILPIDGMAFSGALGTVKSDPAFYPAAERSLGIDGRGTDVVFVDDSLGNIEAAQAHGWHGVHFDKRSDWRTRITSALEVAGHGDGDPTSG